jgi:hypothetical protein
MQDLSDFVSNWSFLVIEFGRLGMRIISNCSLSVSWICDSTPNSAMGEGPHVAHQDGYRCQFSLAHKEIFQKVLGDS